MKQTITGYQIAEWIAVGQFTKNEMDAMITAIKENRANANRLAKSRLNVGVTVKWKSSRTGGTETGVVVKINTKNVIVQQDRLKWNIPASMLEVV
jgi:hypothetical protein